MAYVNTIQIASNTFRDIMESVDTRIFRGTCSTAGSSQIKTVTLDDATNFSLNDGIKVAVTFTYANTNSSPELNVNNSGNFPVVIYNSSGSTSSSGDTYNTWGDYETVIFTLNYGTSSSSAVWVNSGSGKGIGSAYELANSAVTTAGSGLTKSGKVLNHSNSISAGTAGVNSDTSGSSIKIPYIAYDAQGHLTAANTRTHTIPAMTSSSNGIGRINAGTNTSVSYSNGVVTISATNYTPGTGLTLSGTTLNHSNSVSGGAGTIGVSTATTGSTLEVPWATYDAQGHITGKGTHTHTISGFATENNKVTQTNTTTNANYRVLLSNNANNTNETEASRKSSGLVFNPSETKMKVGSHTSVGNFTFYNANGTTESAYGVGLGIDSATSYSVSLSDVGSSLKLFKYASSRSSDGVIQSGNYVESSSVLNYNSLTIRNYSASGVSSSYTNLTPTSLSFYNSSGSNPKTITWLKVQSWDDLVETGVTKSGTQSLSNKTLVSPQVIGTLTIDGQIKGKNESSSINIEHATLKDVTLDNTIYGGSGTTYLTISKRGASTSGSIIEGSVRGDGIYLLAGCRINSSSTSSGGLWLLQLRTGGTSSYKALVAPSDGGPTITVDGLSYSVRTGIANWYFTIIGTGT